MKRAIIAASFILLSVYGHSQVLISILLGDKLNSGKLEFGLDGGVNYSQLDQSKANGTFNLGFYFDFKLKNPNLMFHTGVIVKSTMGAKDLPTYLLNDPELDAAFAVGSSVERRLSYFNVPLMLKHKFSAHFFYEIGTMLGLMNGASDVFSRKVKDKDDLQYTIKTKDNYHPLDAGMLIGVGYRIFKGNGMNLGLRYYYGLVDITIDDTTANQVNRSLYLSLGIPIGIKNNTQEVVNE